MLRLWPFGPLCLPSHNPSSKKSKSHTSNTQKRTCDVAGARIRASGGDSSRAGRSGVLGVRRGSGADSSSAGDGGGQSRGGSRRGQDEDRVGSSWHSWEADLGGDNALEGVVGFVGDHLGAEGRNCGEDLVCRWDVEVSSRNEETKPEGLHTESDLRTAALENAFRGESIATVIVGWLAHTSSVLGLAVGALGKGVVEALDGAVGNVAGQGEGIAMVMAGVRSDAENADRDGQEGSSELHFGEIGNPGRLVLAERGKRDKRLVI